MVASMIFFYIKLPLERSKTVEEQNNDIHLLSVPKLSVPIFCHDIKLSTKICRFNIMIIRDNFFIELWVF